MGLWGITLVLFSARCASYRSSPAGGERETRMDRSGPLTVDERLALIELEVGDLVLRQDRGLADLREIRTELHQWRLQLQRVLTSAA